MIQSQLNAMPHVQMLFDAKVTQVMQTADQVQVAFTQADEARTLQAHYLIGADGAWSAVRRSLNIEFEGFTYPERFLVVSTAFEYADHLPRLSYVNYCSDPQEWCVLLRVPTLWRVLFPTKAEETDEAVLTDESVQARLQNLLPQAQPYVTQHRTLYKVHQRVAQRFRHGRVVLAGDAAHINNPLGGMGMNGGIHDAMNLCEKLLAVLQKGESDAVLDQYERQRRTIAIDYINASTARNKRDIEERDPVKRKENQQALRDLSLDPVRARAYIRQSSMIDALDRAKAIA
jgi:3-(3-hydroxy-phenyl)propionate hydroxylase